MKKTIPSRNRWNFGDYFDIDSELGFSDLVNYYISNMFNRTLLMFEYGNLPDKMNSFDMEKFTQLNGKSIFLEGKDRFYVLEGEAWNDITWNYEPDKALVVNPALPYLKSEYTLGKDAVVIRNDYLMLGLSQIFYKNSIDLANTDISIRYAMFNSRLKSVLATDDDNGKASIDGLMEHVWDGEKPYAVVTPNLYKKNPVDSLPYANVSNNDIKDLMELKQYQLAQYFIELCLNANYNMKRENIGKSEATLMNEDVILPLIDQMLKCRQMAVEEINNLFGLNITVKLSSAWQKIQNEVKMDLAKQEADVKKVEAEAESTAEGENNPEEPKTKDEEGDNNVDEA